jgi:hypothetical protein
MKVVFLTLSEKFNGVFEIYDRDSDCCIINLNFKNTTNELLKSLEKLICVKD